MSLPDLSGVLMQWLVLLPIVFVFLGGVIVAFVFWRTCPRPALLTLLGVFILFVTMAVWPFVNFWLVRMQYTQHWNMRQFGFYMSGVSVVLNVVRALGFALLLAAVFVGRRPAQPVYPPLPTDPRFL